MREFLLLTFIIFLILIGCGCTEKVDPIAEAQIIKIECIDRVTTLVIQEGDKTYHVPAYDSLGEFRCKK